MNFAKRNLRPIISGLLLALSLLDRFELCIFIALIPLFLDWAQNNMKLSSYFRSGFIAQFIFLAVAFFWIQTAGKNYFLLNPFSRFLFYFAFTAVLSLHWALIGLFFGWAQKLCPQRLILLLPFFMVLLDEIVFKFMPFHFGFHWYAAGLPGTTWASVVGLGGLGFLILYVNLFFALLIQRRCIKISLLGFAGFVVFSIAAPKVNLASELSGEKLNVLGVQGNISNEVKRTDLQEASNKMVTVDKYYAWTRRALQQNGQRSFDLIVWPETTLPFIWKEKKWNDMGDILQADVLGFARRLQIPILSGSYFGHHGIYNAAILVNTDESFQHSEKKYLFPIGEVIPFNDFGGLTRDLFPEVPRFNSEMPPNAFAIKNYKTVVPICYEALFSDYFESFSLPIDWIVSISNDAWFDSSLQRRWHALMAMARSVEYQVPVLRVTNDGASGIATPDGAYTFFAAKTELAFRAEVPMAHQKDKSFMQKNGDVVNRLPRFVAYLISAWLIGLAIKRRFRT